MLLHCFTTLFIFLPIVKVVRASPSLQPTALTQNLPMKFIFGLPTHQRDTRYRFGLDHAWIAQFLEIL